MLKELYGRFPNTWRHYMDSFFLKSCPLGGNGWPETWSSLSQRMCVYHGEGGLQPFALDWAFPSQSWLQPASHPHSCLENLIFVKFSVSSGERIHGASVGYCFSGQKGFVIRRPPFKAVSCPLCANSRKKQQKASFWIKNHWDPQQKSSSIQTQKLNSEPNPCLVFWSLSVEYTGLLSE